MHKMMMCVYYCVNAIAGKYIEELKESWTLLKSSNKWALAITQWNLCKSSLANALTSSEFTIHCLKL